MISLTTDGILESRIQGSTYLKGLLEDTNEIMLIKFKVRAVEK